MPGISPSPLPVFPYWLKIFHPNQGNPLYLALVYDGKKIDFEDESDTPKAMFEIDKSRLACSCSSAPITLKMYHESFISLQCQHLM
jgi:hypothetical protein